MIPGSRATIVAIRSQRRAIVDVVFDDGVVVRLPKSIAADLRVGETASRDEITDLLVRAATMRVVRLIDRLCHYRPRSVSEVRQRLRSRGVPAAIIEAAIDRRLGSGILDDSDFAALWVDRQARRGKGDAAIRFDLVRFGLDPSTIAAAVRQTDRQAALAEAIRRSRRGLDLADPRDRRRFVQRLVGRGFERNVALDALRRLATEHDDGEPLTLDASSRARRPQSGAERSRSEQDTFVTLTRDED